MQPVRLSKRINTIAFLDEECSIEWRAGCSDKLHVRFGGGLTPSLTG